MGYSGVTTTLNCKVIQNCGVILPGTYPAQFLSTRGTAQRCLNIFKSFLSLSLQAEMLVACVFSWAGWGPCYALALGKLSPSYPNKCFLVWSLDW